MAERIRIQKILDSAKGEGCTLRLPGCDGGGYSGTTVWCHSPYIEDGKAGKRKSDDPFGCYGCHNCHDILDGRKQLPAQFELNNGVVFVDWAKDFIRDTFHRAMKESWRRLILKGVLK